MSVSERLVNFEVLAQYVGTNPVLQRRVSRKFIESARQTLAEMERAAATRDYESLGRLAHRIRPSVMAMGAAPLTHVVTQMEQAALSKSVEAVHQHLEYLAPMLAQIEREIAAMA